MDFRPSEEQTMLRDSVERFARAEAAASPDRLLRGLTDLGLLALTVPAEAGGMGGGADDAMVMMEAIGHHLLGTSAVGHCTAADVLGRHGSPAQQKAWLAPAIAGQLRIAFGKLETAEFEGELLSGAAPFVADGGAADAFLLLCPAGAFLVRAAAVGLTRQPVRLVDGTVAAGLRLERVAVGRIAMSPEAIEDTMARAAVASCAMMLGTMERLLAETLAYVKTRQQFGVAIGSFQTIQHRMARLFVANGQCRSLLLSAALGERGDRRAWLRSVAAAQALTAERSMQLAHECVQFHGGMGITQELAVSRGHKQLMVLSRLFGSAADARLSFDRLAAPAP